MILKWASIAVLWVLLVGGAIVYRYVDRQVVVGAGYAAKEVCSCIYLGERSFDSCRSDLPPFLDRIDVSWDAAERSVRGSVRGFSERRAQFSDDGGGCTLY